MKMSMFKNEEEGITTKLPEHPLPHSSVDTPFYGKRSQRATASPQRRYLPTLADLVDRLTIVQLKAIFIPEHKEAYAKERADIEHDIDLILQEKQLKLGSIEIHAIIVLAIANRFIWENESKARAGGPEQDKLLKLTHSINGVRAAAKNRLAEVDGGRKDYKIDALAADLPVEFGSWNVFDVGKVV